MFWRRIAPCLAFPIAALVTLLVVVAAHAQPPPPRGFSTVEVREDELIYRVYAFSETLTLDLSDLELWTDIIGKDPLRRVYWNEPDFRLLLLENGLASLRDESNASESYVSAQKKAQADGLGMWFVSPVPTPTTLPSPTRSRTPTPRVEPTSPSTRQPTPTPTSTPSPTPALGERIGAVVSEIQWVQVGKTAVAILGFLGAIEFAQLIVGYFRRHHVNLIIMGEKSSGKTWLWKRIRRKNITLAELLSEDKPTTEVEQQRLGMITMGEYKIYPKLVDLPGTPKGMQADWLIDDRRLHFLHRLIVPQKRVWIIVLATTQDKRATRDSEEGVKMNINYIDQQLGYLALPMGVLGAKRIRKPQCIVVCLAKVDLFVIHDPRLNPSDPALEQLNKVFSEHIRRVKTDCKQLEIPFVFEFVSAKEGWGRSELMDAIQSALYGPREER